MMKCIALFILLLISFLENIGHRNLLQLALMNEWWPIQDLRYHQTNQP